MLQELMITGQVKNTYVLYAEDRQMFLTTLYGPKHRVVASGYGRTIEDSMRAAVTDLGPPTLPPAPTAAPLDMMPILPGKDMTR